jgi:holliday junction DNA helicase RuvA
MYESIRGTLKDKTPNQTIVECNGIAYRLAIPLSTYTRLPAPETAVTLYLSQIIREDAHTLYAFFLKEERDLFETLLTISGIGPKTAASIIGHMEIGAFQRAIATADVRLLSKMPGIGKKSAERLVIEMRDKFKGKGKAAGLPIPQAGDGIVGDAMNALINLGYNALDAHKAVQAAHDKHPDEKDLGRLITAALRQI